MSRRFNDPWTRIVRGASAVLPVHQAVFLKPGAAVEATLTLVPGTPDRVVVSCSTMCGCPIGCRFCGAGDFFVRNLTASEILSQVLHLLEESPRENAGPDARPLQVRFDRMGEPTLNRAIAPALLALGESYPLASLMICTSAPCVPWDWLFELGGQLPQLDVRFSIHESTDSARNQRIPFPRKMNLKAIAELGSAWHRHTGRKVGFNYCTHVGNASDDDAGRLEELLDPATWNATVSITFDKSANSAGVPMHTALLAREFAGKLRARGFATEILDAPQAGTLGAGPGQLWQAQRWARTHPDRLCARIVSRT